MDQDLRKPNSTDVRTSGSLDSGTRPPRIYMLEKFLNSFSSAPLLIGIPLAGLAKGYCDAEGISLPDPVGSALAFGPTALDAITIGALGVAFDIADRKRNSYQPEGIGKLRSALMFGGIGAATGLFRGGALTLAGYGAGYVLGSSVNFLQSLH